MAGFNKVILMGNVTRNPEVRYIPGKELAVAKLGLAVNTRRSKDKEEVCFIDITAFGKLGEFCGEFVTKGMPILVEGRLNFNSWEQDGQKRSKHEVIAESIQLVSRKERNEGGSSYNSGGGSDNIEEDDIPF